MPGLPSFFLPPTNFMGLSSSSDCRTKPHNHDRLSPTWRSPSSSWNCGLLRRSDRASGATDQSRNVNCHRLATKGEGGAKGHFTSLLSSLISHLHHDGGVWSGKTQKLNPEWSNASRAPIQHYCIAELTIFGINEQVTSRQDGKPVHVKIFI